MRRFELDTRFWEADVRYGTLRMRWGTIGAAGHKQHELALGEELAIERMNEQCTARLYEGYLEVTDQVAAQAKATPQRWWGRFERGASYIELGLNDRTVRHRRGDTLSKEIDTANKQVNREAALELVHKISKLALADGYRLVREGEPALAPHSFDPQLEAQCRADPDDESPWAVYADWLIGEGDVRGELAALHLGGKPAEATELLRAQRSVLFGVNADSLIDVVELTWHHGFVTGAGFQHTYSLVLDELVREFLALPIAHFVNTLRLKDGDDDALSAIIESSQARHLRELRYGGRFSTSFEWNKLPALVILRLEGLAGNPGTFEHPLLERLACNVGYYGTELEVLAAIRCPRLTHFELGLAAISDDNANNLVPLLDTLLQTAELPALVHLGLSHCAVLEGLIPVLAGAPILARLRTLDLSNGEAARKATTALATHAHAFRHLESIELDGNFLNAGQIAQLAKVLPNARIGTQQVREQPTLVRTRRTKKPPSGPVLPTRRTKS